MDTISLSNQVFVLMGVSGSGKSAVANEVAYQLRAAFLDGDFLHPRSNIKKMAAGYPLNDDNRRPWLEAINNAAFAMQHINNNVSLIVCSALKKSYRDIVRKGNENLFFVYLQGDFNIIENRLRARKGHFFKPQMLVTQFATLEEPDSTENDVLVININRPLDAVVASTIKTIDNAIARQK